jgi:acyl dehydratase
MLDYRNTRAFDSGEVRQAWNARDTIVYALGLGFGSDPLDPGQLRFVLEPDLAVMPTMAAVLASPGFWMRERRDLGIDSAKLVHGEQSLWVHGPLPPEGSVVGRTVVTRLVDKGEGKGAVIHAEKRLFDEGSGTLLAVVESVYVCRGDGGFSRGGGADEAAAPLVATPASAPSLALDFPTRPEQALVYRLSGDRNPLHTDPALARKLGFERPILHGLATWGMAGRAITAACLDNAPARLRSLRARFSAPVLPGDTLRAEIWPREHGAAFRLRALERDVLVLTHGEATFA